MTLNNHSVIIFDNMKYEHYTPNKRIDIIILSQKFVTFFCLELLVLDVKFFDSQLSL